MANTHYLILQLETLVGKEPERGTFFKPLGEIHSYNPGRACEEYARTQLHEAMLMEDGITLVAVPARSWTTVKIRAKQQLKFDVQIKGGDDDQPDE